MRISLLLSLVLLLLASPVAEAQQVRQITLDEAIRVALQQNISVRQAANAVEARSLAVSQARAEFLPNISAQVRPTQRYGLAFDQTAGQRVEQTTESLDVGASASVNLFNGFGTTSLVQQRAFQREASTHSLERSRQDVIFTTASGFLQILLDYELVRIQEENLDAQRSQLGRVEELVQAGVRPRADLFQQQALVAERELGVLQSESNLELSKTRLLQVLQLDPFDEYQFVAPSLEAVTLTATHYDLAEMLQVAMNTRSDLRAQNLTIRAAETGVRVARSGYYPSLSVGVSGGTSYSSAFPVGGFGDQFQDNRAGSVGFTLNVPIFDRFQTRSQIEQARLQANNERLVMDNLRQSVALEVRQAYLDYQNSTKRLEVTEKQVAAASAALQAEQERYDLGASTLVELAQARAQYVQASSDRAQSIFQFLFRGAVIEYQLGRLDPAERLLP
jgi:outer membrane protein